MIKSISLTLFLVVFISACRIDGNDTVGQEELNFSTTDDSEIFFKNVRQLYYDLEEIQAANLNVFRIKERSVSEDYPVINLAIVWNWLKDEAYILIEPNEILIEEDPLVVHWRSPVSGEEGIIEYSQGNTMAQLTFANELYNGILNNYTFEIISNGLSEPLLKANKDREAFRKTMADYFRLTRTFDQR